MLYLCSLKQITMLFSLLTGKVVDIPVSLYLSLSDEELQLELQELTAYDFGSDYGVWDNSHLYDKKVDKVEDPEKEVDVPDLLDLTSMEKLEDLDMTISPE